MVYFCKKGQFLKNALLGDSGVIDWGQAAAADGMGAVGTFLEIGLALCETPLTLGALVVAVGWSAGYASATYVLYNH